MVELKFKVVFYTGEETDYPASELNSNSPNTKGWQSPQSAQYPQELGFDLGCLSHLSQVVILSHEAKISTKIEMFVGEGAAYQQASFVRLGYLSLLCNEHSEYRERELKSVFVDNRANFVKLLVHKCHPNKHNPHNQVGIIGVKFIGETLKENLTASSKSLAWPRSESHRSTGTTSEQSHGPTLAFNLEMENKLREIIHLKNQAIKMESFDLAKIYKQQESFLTSTTAQLAQLEEEKAQSVQEENFERAKVLKTEIESLRFHARQGFDPTSMISSMRQSSAQLDLDAQEEFQIHAEFDNEEPDLEQEGVELSPPQPSPALRNMSSPRKKKWEYCLVFSKDCEVDQEDILEEVVKRLHAAGLETLCYAAMEKQGNLVYVQVHAPLHILKNWAHKCGQTVLLDKKLLKRKAQDGHPERGIKPFALNNRDREKRKLSKFGPYKYIYAKYVDDEELQELYGESEANEPFTNVQRLELLLGILGARRLNGGAGLKLRKLEHEEENNMVTHFPLHDTELKENLAEKWQGWDWLPWSIPSTEMKDYFGEQIGMYFEFVRHYLTWIITPSVLGLVVAIVYWVEGPNSAESPITGAYSIFIALWAVCMLEFWKRRQSYLQLFWGMQDVRKESMRNLRPEFKGEKITSPVNGSIIEHYSLNKRKKHQLISHLILLLLILVLLVTMGAVFVFRKFMSGAFAPALPAPDWGKAWGPRIGSFMMYIQIHVMDKVYQLVAIKTTDWENHQTDQAYDDSLIAKLFLFQFFNSYGSFYYIAFVQKWIDGSCDGISCMESLTLNVAIIFLSQLFFGDFSKIFLQHVKHKMEIKVQGVHRNGCLHTLKALVYGMCPCCWKHQQEECTTSEVEYAMPAYDDAMGLFEDYNTIVIQFGYLVLFSAAFPLAPLAALINGFVCVQNDCFKLLHIFRRPLPEPAQDIGTWQAIFNLLVILGVVTNAGLICFVMEDILRYSLAVRFWAFAIIQYVVFSVMYAMQIFIPDVPSAVQMQLERAEFLTKKVIFREQDDQEEEKEGMGSSHENPNSESQALQLVTRKEVFQRYAELIYPSEAQQKKRFLRRSLTGEDDADVKSPTPKKGLLSTHRASTIAPGNFQTPKSENT